MDAPTREPERFAIGDTLSFKRVLPDYPASAGWSLLYNIRGGASAALEPVFFSSTADGDDHLVTVAKEVTSAWTAGEYVLVGFILNSYGGRYQFYYGSLSLLANLGAPGDEKPVTTHAQRMIALLENQLEELARHAIDSSNVQQAEFRRVRRLDLEEQLARNKEIRMSEIALDNIRNGKPSGYRTTALFRIT